MLKKLRENLNLDKLLALIEPCGEVAAAQKHRRLAIRPTRKQIESQYRRIKWLRQKASTDTGLTAGLEDLLHHLPLLAVEQIGASPCLENHEFFEVKSFLWVYARLRSLVVALENQPVYDLPDLDRLFKLLDPEGNGLPAFRISPLFSPPLQKLWDRRSELGAKLKTERAATLEKARAELQMPHLKEEFILSRNQGEAIDPIKNSPWFLVSAESLVNVTFRLRDSIKAIRIKTDVNLLNQQIELAEHKVKTRLTSEIFKHFAALEKAWHTCEELSWDYTLARFAERYQCCIPRLAHTPQRIKISRAVNLPLKLSLESQGRHYQSLDIAFSQSANLITGPNMGGKSTALITLGQLCHLAAWGIPLPAESAELPLFDEVYYNHEGSGQSDNLSSFGKEVVSLVQFLSRSGTNLILLDEFARGTNPEEGEKLFLAVLKHLSQSGNTLVAASHFTAPTLLPELVHYSIRGISETQLKALENRQPGKLEERLKGLAEAMDYSLVKLRKHQAPPQYAVRIAGILGLPEEIMQFLKGDGNG